MFETIKILWWGWLAIGFIVGAYLHCHIARHWLHLLIIAILKSCIWMLRKTDFYYKPPKTEKIKPAISKPAKPVSDYGELKTGVEVEPDELTKWLEKNPELSVKIN